MRFAIYGLGLLAALSTTSLARADDATPPTKLKGGKLNQMSLEQLLAIRINVSSATEAKTIFNTPSTVSVIDRQTIKEYNFTSVAEALRTLAGVQVDRTYLMRDIPTIRGILEEHYTDKVLILIDGVPAWSAVTGDGNINRVDINDVQRIEVLRGPASVIYGTNAYSGAINLVLRKRKASAAGKGRDVEMRARVDQLGTLYAGGTATKATKRWSVAVSGNADTTNGRRYPFTDERNVSGDVTDLQKKANASLTAQYHDGFGTHQLLLNAYHIEETFLGVLPQYLSGAGNLQFLSGYLANYNYKVVLGKAVNIDAGATFDWNKRDFSAKDDNTVRRRSEGYRVQPFIKSALHLAKWLTVELGGDYDYRKASDFVTYDSVTQNIVNDNALDGKSVDEWSVFAQAQVEGKPLPLHLPLTLLVGSRYTQNQLFKGNLSFRGTLLYAISKTSSLKLVAGQSYRAPTLYELYFKSPLSELAVSGNPKLEPETSQSIELSYLLGIGDFFGQLTGYYSTYNHKIFRVHDTSSVDPNAQVYTNGPKLAAWGAEVELRYRVPHLFDAFINYTWMQGDKGDRLPSDPKSYNFRYVPQHMATAGLAGWWRNFEVSTVVNFVSQRHGAVKLIPAQATWDATIAYQSSWGRHALSAKNILDTRLQTPDYVRRATAITHQENAYYSEIGRVISYTFTAKF